MSETKGPKRGEPGWTPSKLSSSMASLYMQCPRKWKWQYIEGIRTGTTMAMLVGTFAHEVLEYLYQENGEDRTVETARGIAQTQWTELEETEDFIQLELDEEGEKLFKHKVWQNVAGIFEMEDPTRIDVIATEQNLVVEIDGVPYGGFVDRLDREGDGVAVVDYKTGKPGHERYWPKKLEQVQLYAAMVREELGETPTRVSLAFPSHQKTVEAPTNPRAQKKVTNKLRGTWEDIHKSMKKDDFPPSVGPLCAWCDFVAECPEGEQETRARWRDPNMNVREDAPAVKILGLE